MASIGTLLDGGWRLCYTDGTGREGQVAAGVFSEDRKANPSQTYGTFGGPLCSVADGERLAIALALEKEESNMIAIISDSQAAVHTVWNLSRGQPPRSDIELRIHQALRKDSRERWLTGERNSSPS